MKSFKQFLTEGFTHSKHLEDMVIDLGVDGTRAAITALRDFRDAFAGKGGKHPSLSVKFDGAPAVIFGTDPISKKFFVGTKGVFAKNPKMNFVHADIDENHSGDLANKLHEALDNLPKITPKGRVFQGDFMFSKSDLGHQVINGEPNVTMHPNTIVYTAPLNSDIGKKITGAKMGIVVHTEYTGGPDVQSMKPKFGISINDFGNSKDVWLIGAQYESGEGVANLTAAETAEFDKLLSDAGKYFKSISSSTFKLLSTDEELNGLVNMFANSKIRTGEGMDPSKHAHQLKDWIEYRFQKDIDSKKTEVSKEKVRQKLKDVHDKIDVDELTNIFILQSIIAQGKQLVINKLNEIKQLGTFVKTTGGEFRVTNHEGFVGVSGDIAGVKLVDRLEFSHNNFSKSILKGWDSAGRN